MVVDAAANPSVLAGTGGTGSSRQLAEHNCIGTLNLLEYCRRSGAAFSMLSTSRVYSIAVLSELTMSVVGQRFSRISRVLFRAVFPQRGSLRSSVRLPRYHSTANQNLPPEVLALEYGCTFNFPVWINRCGVLAGAGQFARAIRESSATGFIPGASVDHSNISGLADTDIRFATVFIRGIWFR
ncbi:MAG UNVERIFIED_CONTAM: hypothetical protein LVR18_26170 [Planctomycetaceae bacterium]|jgi:CDP-paratose 2-epimerase